MKDIKIKNLWIFGAGASACLGLPVSLNFLKNLWNDAYIVLVLMRIMKKTREIY